MTTTTSVRRPDPARFSDRARRDRRRRWLRRLIALALIGLIVGSVWAVGWSSVLGVREVTVQGQHRTPSTTVREAAKVPMDQPMVRLDVAAIERRVESLPTVQSAQVARVWPHTVRISLTERVPVAVVRHGSERRFISADGVDFAPATPQTHLPLIDLDVAVASRDRVTTGLAVVEQLPAAVRSRLEAIEVYDPTDVRLSLRGDAVVYWGSAGQTVAKAEVFAALLAKHPRALTFDVSAPDAPTVRP